MHEYSIVQALVEKVRLEAESRGAVAVQEVRVLIGELAGVETGLLSSAYELFRQGTVCEGAELELVPVAARWICSGCEKEVPAGGPLRCSECGLPGRLSAGDEIVLDRLVLEVA